MNLAVVFTIAFMIGFLLQCGIFKIIRKKLVMVFVPVILSVCIIYVFLKYRTYSLFTSEAGYIIIAIYCGFPSLFGSIIGGYAAIKNDRIKQDIKKKDSADKFAIRGFNCEKLKINFLSDDKIHSHTMLKTIVGENIEDELNIFRLSILINEQEYTNTRNFELMEMAIIDLQKQLPEDMHILCCQTCRYGNYNPFGDNDNEMFCLINHSIKSKSDLIHLITANPHDAFTINKLTHWCEKYEKINDDYYTYNDWIYHFKDDKKY